MSSEDSPFLGGGAYGKVFEARRSSLCAIKVIPYEQTIPVNAIREIATLRRLERTDGRERFARLLDVDFRQQEVVLTLQYGRRGNLAERLEEAQPPMSKKLLWAAQLMEGLETLHRENLLHRDLKPENIVLTDRDDLKLIDFGLSRPFLTDEPLTPLVCTLYYRPPEILVQTIMSYGDGGGGVVYGTEVDCWSAGCVLRELATGRGPEFRPAVPSPNLVASSEQQLQSILG